MCILHTTTYTTCGHSLPVHSPCAWYLEYGIKTNHNCPNIIKLHARADQRCMRSAPGYCNKSDVKHAQRFDHLWREIYALTMEPGVVERRRVSSHNRLAFEDILSRLTVQYLDALEHEGMTMELGRSGWLGGEAHQMDGSMFDADVMICYR